MIILYNVYIAVFTGGLLTFLLFRFLKSKKQTTTGLLFIFFVYVTHDYYLSVYANGSEYKLVEYIAYYVVMWLVLIIFFEGKGISNFITVFSIDFIFQVTGTILVLVVLSPITFFDVYEIERITDTPNLFSFLLAFVVSFASYFLTGIIAKNLFKKNNRFTRFVCTGITLVNFIPGFLNSGKSVYYVFPLFVLIIVGNMTYQELKLIKNEKRDKYYYELEHALQIKQEELAKIRHDVANHISVIDSSRDSDYGNEVLREIDEKLMSGISIIDVLIKEKQLICNGKKIFFHYELINLSESRMERVDWICLLGNALDNAIDASEKAGGDRTIELSMKRKASYLVIYIANSKDKDRKPESNHFMTTKLSGQGHGYGIKIMEKTVKKYGGRIRYEDKGDSMQMYITFQAWE